MTTFKLEIPTYSEAEIAENPWGAVEVKIWEALQEAIAPSSDLASAASSINQLFPTNRPTDLGPSRKEEPESFLLEFWGIVIQAATQIPATDPAQDRLFELVKALHALPNPIEVTFEGSDAPVKVWTDLPKLDPAVWDISNQGPGANFHGFVARIAGTGFGTAFWSLALTSLNEALEMEPPASSSTYSKQGPRIDAAIPGAVAWIEHAGAQLYEKSVAGELKDTDMALGGTWSGERGLSKRRWYYWKTRFGELADDERVSQETKELAKKAKALMDSSEA